MMQTTNKKQLTKNANAIKKFIRKNGGLYITNRQVGKTQALIELLHEDDDSYIVTFNYSMMKHLRNRYMMNFKDGKEKRIFCQHSTDKNDMKKTYIDEYFFHDTLHKNFKGAVSTMSFPMIIKRLKNNPKISDEEMKGCLTEQQYAQEHSLKFK